MLLDDDSSLRRAAARGTTIGIAVACIVGIAAFITSLVALSNSSSASVSGGGSLGLPPPLPLIASAYANKNILMIAAHPDDVVGANGGFVFELTESGANVSVLIITNGNAGCNQSITKEECGDIRRGEEKACDAVLGVNPKYVTVLNFFDNHLWDGTYNTTSIVEQIVLAVRATQPYAIFTFYPDPMWNLSPRDGYDDMGFHPDHQFVGKAVASAVAGFSVSDLSIYNASFGPSWSPTELWFWNFFKPPYCLILSSAALAAKVDGFLEHRSQYTNRSDMVDWITQFSLIIGANCGFGRGIAAEGFQRFI